MKRREDAVYRCMGSPSGRVFRLAGSTRKCGASAVKHRQICVTLQISAVYCQGVFRLAIPLLWVCVTVLRQASSGAHAGAPLHLAPRQAQGRTCVSASGATQSSDGHPTADCGCTTGARPCYTRPSKRATVSARYQANARFSVRCRHRQRRRRSGHPPQHHRL
jgi:hypothetical protein